MQRRRGSEGENSKPQRVLRAGLGDEVPEEEVDVEDAPGAAEAYEYEISVGTLSLVIPLLPGHVLMISTSSGVDVYTVATLDGISLSSPVLQSLSQSP